MVIRRARVNKKRVHAAAVLVLGIALFIGAPAARAAVADTVAVGAAGAVLMDMETTRVLAGKNAHERLPMASTTKIMTALLAVENSGMQDWVTIKEEAVGVEGSSMYLHLGEKLSMEDLLYGLMLSSGNDAAVAIAVHVGGSLESFIQMMNNRAAKLGCVNTHFVTPNGLHDKEHYTSAYDLALIAAEAMKNPAFAKIVSTQYWRCETGDTPRTVKNKNKILWNYAGGSGIKTGFTKAAGRCLAFSAQRDGRTLVGVVLNSPDMWGAATYLLDDGFASVHWETLITSGKAMREIAVEYGMKNSLEIVAKEDILFPLRKDEEVAVAQIKLNCPQKLAAPIMEGQTVGSADIWCDGRLLKSVSLVAKETVQRKEYPYYFWRLIQDFA